MKSAFVFATLALVFATTAAQAQSKPQYTDLTTIDTSVFPDLTPSCIDELNKAISSARDLRDKADSGQQGAVMLFVQAAESAVVGGCQIELQKKAEKEAEKATTQKQLDTIRYEAIATSAAIKTESNRYLSLYQFR